MKGCAVALMNGKVEALMELCFGVFVEFVKFMKTSEIV